MMALDPTLALSLFHRALEAEIGIAVATDDPKGFREDLSAARREALDPRLDAIVTFIPNDLKEVWLVKKETEL